MMFIRLFAQTKSDDEAKEIFSEIISTLSGKVDNYTFKKIEPYWKIEGITVVEVKIGLALRLSDDECERFLSSISDKWTYLGNPIDEALASRTTEGCNFLKNGVEMINIFF